jgi:hypothetical protein
MSDMIKIMARSLSKETLVVHLKEAIRLYEVLPVDDNWARIASCAALLAIKESADMDRIEHLLEKMAANTVPFLSASAN